MRRWLLFWIKFFKNMMIITVLNNELNCFQEENSGFSVLIESDDKKILFDLSYKDDIYKNVKKGNVDLNKIDFIVLSHSHIDHTEGLRFFDFSLAKNLLAHPDCFKEIYYEGEFAGCPLKLDYLKRKINVILTKESHWISENIVFLGQIPRKNDFEVKSPVGYLKTGEEDFVLEDSAIAVKTKKGIVIITGCSHSGICNIIEYAKLICNDNRVYSILGGLHLFENNLIEKTINYLKTQNIKFIYAAHCLSDFGFQEFAKIGGIRLKTLEKLKI